MAIRLPSGSCRPAFQLPVRKSHNAAHDLRRTSFMFVVIGLMAAYLLLNITLNLVTRYVLGIIGFALPMLLTMSHTAVGFVGLTVFNWAAPNKVAESPGHWQGLLCAGGLSALNIGLNNLSLVSLPLSINQVLRCGSAWHFV